MAKIIETDFSASQCLEKLSSSTEKEKYSIFIFPWWFLSGKFYSRVYNKNKFYLYKMPSKPDLLLGFRTYFMPVLYGKFIQNGEKTKISLKFGFHPILILLLLVFLFSMILVVFKNYAEIFSDSKNLLWIVVFIVIAIFVFLPWHKDKKEILAFISNILRQA